MFDDGGPIEIATAPNASMIKVVSEFTYLGVMVSKEVTDYIPLNLESIFTGSKQKTRVIHGGNFPHRWLSRPICLKLFGFHNGFIYTTICWCGSPTDL